MDCKQADNLMIDFLYGELSPGDRAEFENHLKSCPEHAREVEKLRGVLNLVRSQEPEEVPEEVSARIMANARARMPQKTKPSPFFSLIWNPVAAAAVLALVVVTVGLATYFTSETGPVEEPALEAARPLAAAEKPRPLPVLAETKDEEKKEYKAAPEPEAPATEPAPGVSPPPKPKTAEKIYKSPRRAKRRKSPGKKKAYKSTYAPPPKTPEVWGSRAKPKAGLSTGATGGAAIPGDTAVMGKTDRGMEGTSKAEYEKKTKDKKKESRPAGERDFAEPPPPMKAAPPPAPSAPREEMIEAESVAVSADMEDDSHPQATPRARKVAEKKPADYYQAAEGDLARKRYDAAVSKYRTFLAQNPSDPRAATARYRIAKALFLAGRCAEAVQAVDTAVSAAPRHPMAPNALLDQGSCYEKLNRLSEANATYRRINRDYPSYTEEAQKGMRRTRREAGTDVRPTSTEQHR